MEQSINNVTYAKETWLAKRYRTLVFNVFNSLTGGELTVCEGSKQYQFSTDKPAEQAIDAKITVHDISVYRDFVKGGSIGAAEAFIEGKWSSPDLTAVIRLVARSQKQLDSLEKQKSWLRKFAEVIYHRLNRNTQTGSKRNILAHYDLGNELYQRFLDPQMMYSAAIYPFSGADLATAQLHKLETICQRLALTEEDHLLEIGTGWGGLAIYAAQKYGCKVTTTTISNEQYQYASQRVKQLELGDKITLLKKDYRELTGSFDKVVSIEMIEAVGKEFLPSFFKQINERLKAGGKVLIQSITIADQRLVHYQSSVDFIQRYIFPGGFLPSISLLTQQMTEHSNLVVEQLDDIGLDYAKTLAHWRELFLKNWSEISRFGYDEAFKRLWLYYFAYCEGAFLERSTSTVHLVARK